MKRLSKKKFTVVSLLVVLLAWVVASPMQKLPLVATAFIFGWVGYMKVRSDNTEVQVQGCHSFVYVAQKFATNKDWMGYVGAIDASLVALRSFPDSKEVQHACVRGVSEMALYSWPNQDMAGQKGAVELVLDAQNRWPEDANMQMGGSSGCFMDFSEANRIRFAQHGGMKVLLDAIRNHFDSPEVVVQSWFGFSSGTQHPNAAAFVEAGGLEMGIKSMRAHAKSPRVREEVMQAFRTPLFSDNKNRVAVAEAGYISDLVTTMHDAPFDYHQISPACANLVILTLENRTNRLMAVEAGATQAALKAVVDFPSMKPTVGWAVEFDAQYTVNEDCIGLLAILLANCEAHQYLVESNASNVVEEVLSGGRDSIAAQGSMAMAGWGSDSSRLRRIGQHFLRKLKAPCVEKDEDIISDLRISDLSS